MATNRAMFEPRGVHSNDVSVERMGTVRLQESEDGRLARRRQCGFEAAKG
jgi:hypothetical protein